jgi:hypothetical protein
MIDQDQSVQGSESSNITPETLDRLRLELSRGPLPMEPAGSAAQGADYAPGREVPNIAEPSPAALTA